MQFLLLGGAAHSGPASDTWHLHLIVNRDGEASGGWEAGLPLEAGRSWHTATIPLPVPEVR